MAFAYASDKTTEVAVPTLAGYNCFSGVQTFSNTTASSSTSTGAITITGGLGVQGNIVASQVWGAIWNDLADCIQVPETITPEPGYCYCFDGENYYKASKYLDDGIIGIHSDTAGFMLGYKPEENQLHVAVAGFVLAYVDKEYSTGTPLTVTENGFLTEMKEEDIVKSPHKLIGTFWKTEEADLWGPEDQKVAVKNRFWIKLV